MKVATFNVNSLRKRLPVVKRWFEKPCPGRAAVSPGNESAGFGVPCTSFAATGYHVRFCGMKG